MPDFNDAMTPFLEPLAEEVADLSSELYLISPHQLCILDRGSRRKKMQRVEEVVYPYFMRPSPTLRVPLEHLYT